MSSMQKLTDLLNINDKSITNKETMILEAELFFRIYEELREIIRRENRDYYRLLKMNNKKEIIMLDASFLRCIINDILTSEEYTLSGIAYYTDTPEEVIYEVVTGRNNNPTLTLSQRVIELHRSIRPQLYKNIINKIKHDNYEEASS